MSVDFLSWPIVPEDQRPRVLYHAGMNGDEAQALSSAGWEPKDVRLLPNKTDDQRADAIKAWLEGVRLGSIDATRGVTKFVELEAKIFGLLETKKRVSDKVDLEKETLDELMDF